MALTMTYDEWMKDTHSMIKARSESLKKIDNFIKFRNEAEVLKALTFWIDEQNKKGQDWHRSVRNQKNKAVERLAKQVNYLGASSTVLTPAQKLADSEAKTHTRILIREASKQMFIGKRVVLSNAFLQYILDKKNKGRAKLTKHDKLGLAKDTMAIVSGVKANTYDIATKIKEGIDQIVKGMPEAQKSELLEMALGSGAADFALACAPLIGTLTAGGKTAASLVSAIFNEFDAMKMEDRRADVRPGDASAALEAIVTIIDHEIQKNLKEAGIHGASFAAKAAILCAGVPGDAIVGAVEAVLMLLHNLYELSLQYKQMNAANEKIASGNIDITIFKTCPILGCYYILVQGEFTIMNFDVANMGKNNWMQEVLRLKNALKPVNEKALKLIASSSIVIEGMEKSKGIYQESLWHKIAQPVKNKFGTITPSASGSAGGYVKGAYQLPGIDSGKYSEKELAFLKLFAPAE